MAERAVIDVRTARPEDWRVFRDLRLEMLQDAPEAFLTTYEEVVDRPPEQWRSMIGAIPYFLAAGGTGTAMGSVGLLPEPPEADPTGAPAAWLIAMYVRPPARGLGVGERLVNHAARVAAGLGHDRLFLEVTSTNAAAIALYRRVGFTFTGRTREHPRSDLLYEREMVRDLY